MTKPHFFQEVRLFLGATAPVTGHWTGKQWMAKGQVVKPISWTSELPRPDAPPNPLPPA